VRAGAADSDFFHQVWAGFRRLWAGRGELTSLPVFIHSGIQAVN
jgi:hypothetical protein